MGNKKDLIPFNRITFIQDDSAEHDKVYVNGVYTGQWMDNAYNMLLKTAMLIDKSKPSKEFYLYVPDLPLSDEEYKIVEDYMQQDTYYIPIELEEAIATGNKEEIVKILTRKVDLR